MPAESSIPDPCAEADALVAAGEAVRAVELLRARLSQGRGGILMRLALGRALLAAGDTSGALEVLREASALAPSIAEVALALGGALLAGKHLPTAIAEFQRALRLDPGCDAARYALGNAWAEAGEIERALQMFAELEGAPAFAAKVAERKPMLEAILRAPRSPAGYVRHLFDQFSADYDARMLGHLTYSAHVILRSLADLLLANEAAPKRILDLGCGTGLAGEAFKDLVRGGTLDGVDLSPRMIEKSRNRGIYDALAVGDLQTALERTEGVYDLLIAADTFVYLGDLAPVLAPAYRCLTDGGFLLFTVERDEGDSYALGPKRRYRHAEAYLRREGERAGFEVAGMLECSPRTEGQAKVEGWAVALRKPPATSS